MSVKDKPAFPHSANIAPPEEPPLFILSPGLTKRELLAAMTFHAMASNPDLTEVVTAGNIQDGSYAERAAKKSCEWADALIAELEKK